MSIKSLWVGYYQFCLVSWETKICMKPSTQKRRGTQEAKNPNLQACAKAPLNTPAAMAEVSGAVGALEKHSYFTDCWNCLSLLEALWRKGNKLEESKRSPRSLHWNLRERSLRNCSVGWDPVPSRKRAQFKNDTEVNSLLIMVWKSCRFYPITPIHRGFNQHISTNPWKTGRKDSAFILEIY